MATPRAAHRMSRTDTAAMKRDRIIDAATDLFYERGFRNTTLDDVAERLGATKPVLYSSFSSKTEILAEICTKALETVLAQAEYAATLDLGPREKLELFVPRYAVAVLRVQKNIAINIREEKNLDPVDAERLALLRQRFMSQVEGLLRACTDSGELRITDNRVAAFAVVGAVSWTTFWYNPGGVLPSDVVANRLSDFILGQLRAPAAEPVQVAT